MAHHTLRRSEMASSASPDAAQRRCDPAGWAHERSPRSGLPTRPDVRTPQHDRHRTGRGCRRPARGRPGRRGLGGAGDELAPGLPAALPPSRRGRPHLARGVADHRPRWLDSLHERMAWADVEGRPGPLDAAFAGDGGGAPLGPRPSGARALPTALSVPYAAGAPRETRCAVGSTSGSRPGPSSRRAPRPWAASSTTPTGSTSPTARSSCSAPPPRWGRSGPCSGGAPTSLQWTCREKNCGTG